MGETKKTTSGSQETSSTVPSIRWMQLFSKFPSWRILLFALILILVAGLIAYAEHVGWRQARFSLQKVQMVNPERFRLAQELEGTILGMNATVARFQTNLLGPDRHDFMQEREALMQLVSEHQDLLTESEKTLVEKFSNDFEDYVKSAKALLKRKKERVDPHEAASNLLVKSGQLLNTCQHLKTAQKLALDDYINTSVSRTRELHGLLLAWSVLLPLAGVGLIGMVYRRTVAPLHKKLEENEAVMARQEKLASLGIFAAGVAHEIRNPLMAMKVHLFSLSKHLPPESKPQAEAAILSNEINRLERIVKDFLEFARPADPVPTELQASDLLHEVADLIRAKCPRKTVRVHVEAEGQLSFRADRGQLKQVLINLGQNAVESIAGEGTVTLRTRIGLDAVRGRKGALMIFEVQDNGQGIPREIQQRLFDPFVTTKADGTGLGLSIASRIIDKHGGTIRFQSNPEQGTTFTILLPISHETRTENFAG